MYIYVYITHTICNTISSYKIYMFVAVLCTAYASVVIEKWPPSGDHLK